VIELASAARIAIGSVFDPKGLRDATKEVGDFAEKGGKGFGDFAKKATIAFAAIGAGAVVIGKKLIDAGEAAATSNARIDNIIGSMGLFDDKLTGVAGSADTVTKRIIDMAEATARATGVDQNAIKATQAKLLTFAELTASAGEVGGSFDRATKAAIDLAAAGFGSAEGNAVQLGKALQDPIKGLASLAKSGVTFTDAEKERIRTLVESNKVGEAQALILEAIEKQVGGTAEATANSSDKMRVAFSQLQERLGQKLLPIFEKFANFVSDKVLPAVEKLVTKGFEELRKVIEKVRPTLNTISDIFETKVQPVLERIGNWMRDNTETVKVFFAVLAGAAVILMLASAAAAIAALFNPITLIVVAIAALAAGLHYAWNNFETFRNVVTAVFEVVKTVVQIAVQFVINWFNAMKDIITGFIQIIRGLFSGDLEMILEGFKNLFGGAIDYVKNLFVTLPQTIIEAAGPGLTNLGKDIVAKILDGIMSNPGAIGSAIMGMLPGGGLIGGTLKRAVDLFRYSGGPIPGSPSTPVPIMAHGGEYVLSADVVEAIRKGNPSRGLDMSAPSFAVPSISDSYSEEANSNNTTVIINTGIDEARVVELLRKYTRLNGPITGVRVAS
jgi:hypothetical protein